MDSLVDRILELESMTETISANDRRFIAVDDTDAFVQAQQNENTRLNRMTDCFFSGAPCRQDRSYDKDVITRLFSYRPYIKVSVVVSPRIPPRADNRRSTLIYGPI